MARLLAAAAVFAFAGTYLFARIDFVRRHRMGIDPVRYLLPQLTHIWIPGLGASVVLGLLAAWLWRRSGA